MKATVIVPCNSDDTLGETVQTTVKAMRKDVYGHATHVVVLSRRAAQTTWDADTWFQGDDLRALMTRLRRHRARQTEKNIQWIVVVDMLDAQPVAPAYNALFKDGNTRIITISDRTDVIKDKRHSEVYWCPAAEDDYIDVAAPPVKTSSWWPW